MPDVHALICADLDRRERCELHAYPDPCSPLGEWREQHPGQPDPSDLGGSPALLARSGAPWTCGVGLTGPDIGPTTVWTQEEADAHRDQRLAPLITWAQALRPDLPAGCIAALVSLAWNVGVDALEHGGTKGAETHVVRLVRAGQLAAAADAFLAWDHVHGRVIKGLLTRRQEERQEFLDALAAPPVGA